MEVNIYLEIKTEKKSSRSKAMYLLEAMKDGEPLMINGEPYVVYEQIEEEHANTTKISMKILVMALSRLTKPCKISVFTENESIYYAIKNGWHLNWKNNNWKNAKGLQIKYVDEWKVIVDILERHEVEVNMQWHTYRKWMQEMMKKEN